MCFILLFLELSLFLIVLLISSWIFARKRQTAEGKKTWGPHNDHNGKQQKKTSKHTTDPEATR